MLGTTPESLDVGLPSGDDVHLDMAREPEVSIAEPATAQNLRIGERVGVVSSGDAPSARPHGIVIFENGVDGLRDGIYAWDAPGGSRVTAGRIIRCDRAHGRLSIVVGYARAERRIAVPLDTRVVTVRPGSRRALLNPHAIFVFATPPTDGLSLVLQRAIVGDGDLALPL